MLLFLFLQVVYVALLLATNMMGLVLLPPLQHHLYQPLMLHLLTEMVSKVIVSQSLVILK